MNLAHSLLLLITARAELLVPLIALGLVLGVWAARLTGVGLLVGATDRTARFLARKLDRANRSIATRVYRGMIAVAFLLIPALAFGIALMQPSPIAHTLGGILLVGLFGYGFGATRPWRYWRLAQRDQLGLSLTERDYLFADSHAVLRYLILENAEGFAVFVVGTSFWYVLFGLPACVLYLALARMALSYRTLAFGWAARSLFQLMDLAPRAFSLVLLTLAALFTPGTRPFAVFRARSFHGVLAYVLNISLGGILPDGELPWAGTGTPMAAAHHLFRLLVLRTVATILLLLALATPVIINILYLK